MLVRWVDTNLTTDGNGSGLDGDLIQPAPIRGGFGSGMFRFGVGMGFWVLTIVGFGEGLVFRVVDLPRSSIYTLLCIHSAISPQQPSEIMLREQSECTRFEFLA